VVPLYAARISYLSETIPLDVECICGREGKVGKATLLKKMTPNERVNSSGRQF
jgi:hypothetical protein